MSNIIINTFNVYMSRQISKSKNTPLSHEEFTRIITVYNMFISLQQDYKFWEYIFDIILKTQPLKLKHVKIIENDIQTLSNFDDNFKRIHKHNIPDIYFFVLSIIGKADHKNLIVVDTTDKTNIFVYKVNPNGITGHSNYIDNLLKQYFTTKYGNNNNLKKVVYKGDLAQYIPCKKIFQLGTIFNSNLLCVSCTLFTLYMLSRNNKKNLFKQNSNTYKNLMVVNNIPIDKFRYIFAKFIEHIAFIYLHQYPEVFKNWKTFLNKELVVPDNKNTTWKKKAILSLMPTNKSYMFLLNDPTNSIKKVYNNGKKLLNNNNN